MDIRLTDATLKDVACDALVVGVATPNGEQQGNTIVLSKTASRVDSLLGGLIQEIYADGEFKGSLGELTTIHSMGKMAAKRVVIVGLGKKSNLSPKGMRRASAIAARHLQNTGAHSIALAIDGEDAEQLVQAEVEGALLGLYTFRKYQHSNASGKERGISKIQILTGNEDDSRLKQAMQRGMIFAE